MVLIFGYIVPTFDPTKGVLLFGNPDVPIDVVLLSRDVVLTLDLGIPFPIGYKNKIRFETDYKSFVEDTIEDLKECINLAHNAGIKDDKIILDPGVGFAKDTEQNLEITASLDKIHELGYPVLLGVSRKSVIGNVLNIPKEERLSGTLALGVYGCLHHAMFLRVHDVK